MLEVRDQPINPPDEADLDWVLEQHRDSFVSLSEHACEIHAEIIAGLCARNQGDCTDDDIDLLADIGKQWHHIKPSVMRDTAISTIGRWINEQYDACNTNEKRFSDDEIQVMKYLMGRV